MGSDPWKRSIVYVLTAVSAGLLLVAVVSWNRLVDLAARISVVPLVLVIGSVACAAAAARVQRQTRPLPLQPSAPPIRWWWVVLAFAAVAAAVWLTTAQLMPQTYSAPPGRERTQQRTDVVRTALAAGAGVGAAITVLLAFRRQHHHEMATKQTEHDANERRVTELYTKAVEQLGSSQAPVRLGGLYALERLGQTAPDHRQTIVDVICAYLRMPFTPPTAPSQQGQPHQELLVRVAAQRILTAHVRDVRPMKQRQSTPLGDRFWEGMRIDLANADLTECSFDKWHVAEANFSNARFTGSAEFPGATFTEGAHFEGAKFGAANFGKATFIGDGLFRNATFTEGAYFGEATFTKSADFLDVTFEGDANFHQATFSGYATFGEATFTSYAGFEGVQFQELAHFGEATFKGTAQFENATFFRTAYFRAATFTGTAQFGTPPFGMAHFYDTAELGGARVTRLVTPEGNQMSHVWPPGWLVRPLPDGEGVLEKAQGPAEP
ncbi:pentapeptide repeat-containing protein [Streptomyces sp. DH10]|uniref:pentapeptide repeat-containing protein n=1 Tax=Streptomyces sp. DH10 TaxID=3040121 RepID=UPI0024417FA1|nr:pentapeptide repeat-containing protein [Streptomyces sp. DH10]MDG9712637.1 pentapeptide repeat-containing protein [Streptomyces sp. DH10]